MGGVNMQKKNVVNYEDLPRLVAMQDDVKLIRAYEDLFRKTCLRWADAAEKENAKLKEALNLKIEGWNSEWDEILADKKRAEARVKILEHSLNETGAIAAVCLAKKKELEADATGRYRTYVEVQNTLKKRVKELEAENKLLCEHNSDVFNAEMEGRKYAEKRVKELEAEKVKVSKQ
jgi:hypothetical protein